jgi:acyl-lipid omega-6 desaturase (Delta-12 desaturase)
VTPPVQLPTADRADQRSWRRAAAPYRSSSARRGVVQLCATLLPLAALLWLMYLSLGLSYWLTLALALPAAGFLVRTFIIMHDCAHGSFVPSRRANEAIGFVTGVLTLTPFAQWRRDHALHHASSGDLDRRGHGDILTLTIEEYLARSRWGRFTYRLYRNPLVLFGLGPLYLLVSARWHSPTPESGAKERASVRATNITILGVAALLSLVIGPKALALVYVPVVLFATTAGVWLFYVQHQFDGTYWTEHGEWDYATAALEGSSYYKLPRVLEWLTGGIGLHHVHHLDPKIPNYNLRRCHDENALFHGVTVLTLRASLRTPSLKLWDAERGRLVGFDAARSAARTSRESRRAEPPSAARPVPA